MYQYYSYSGFHPYIYAGGYLHQDFVSNEYFDIPCYPPFTMDPPPGQWSEPETTSYFNVSPQEHLTPFDAGSILPLASPANLGSLPPSTSLGGLSSSCPPAAPVGLNSPSVPSPYDHSQPGHTDEKEERIRLVPVDMSEGEPITKIHKYHLVNAINGDIIRCWWGDCDEMVEATISAIHAYRMKHHKTDDTCRWKAPGCDAVCTFSGAVIGRHIGSHLHREGQPSPWVVRCECGYRYVMGGSGNKHKPGCRRKKMATRIRKRKTTRTDRAEQEVCDGAQPRGGNVTMQN